MMTRAELKSILKQQAGLLGLAVEDKLEKLAISDDFSSDIFEQVGPEYTGNGFEAAFEESINQADGKKRVILVPKSEDDLDNIYSHRAEDLAKELPKNKIVSYREKLAALRGISLAEDYYSINKQ